MSINIVMNKVNKPNFSIMRRLNVGDFHQEIKKRSSIIIDVRTPKEYKRGAIRGAFNFNFLSKKFIDNFKGLSKNEPLYVYCKSGEKSYNASLKLSKLGFTNVFHLKGGYLTWMKKISV